MQFTATVATVLTLVSLTLAHGDEAESLAVAEFKSGFASAAIVPEVLAAFNPSVAFYVSYQSADGDAALLHPGATLTTAEAKAPFEMSVENIMNVTNVTDSTRFIVYMVCYIVWSICMDTNISIDRS